MLMDNLKYNKIKTKINFSKLKLNKELGHGAFGTVYEANNGKSTNKRIVVKKTKKTIPLQLFSLIVNGKFQGTMFDKEVTALKYLSKLGIAPQIYYSNKDKMIYVIEKLNTTLFDMIQNNEFKNKHLKELTKTFKKLRKTPFIHNDLHEANIMYSKKRNKFYVIDWGIFKIKNECLKRSKNVNKKGTDCYQFTSVNLSILSHLILYLDINVTKFKQGSLKAFLNLFGLNNLDEATQIINM
jgi:tRNA A-37 threonylcarbamoyl transferase component Bud32